jgi:hypothetical protein
MSCQKTSSAINIQVEIDHSGTRDVSLPKNELTSSCTESSSRVDPRSDGCPGTSPFNVSSTSLEYSSSEDYVKQVCLTWDDRVCTKNRALSYESTGDARLDLFFKTIRGISRNTLYELLERSWNVSPCDTLRTMFYVRDCRGGRGERKIFIEFMIWLWRENREYFEKNLPCIPFYGCFKDLRKIIIMNRKIF